MKWTLLALCWISVWGQEPTKSRVGDGLLPDRQIPMANNRANELFEQKNYEEALKTYLDLYSQDTGNGALAYNLGNSYAALGDMEKAGEFYRKALQSDDLLAQKRAKYNLGNLELGANRVKEAIEQYVDYLHDQPDDLDAKRNLELALRRLEQQQQQQQNEDDNKDKQDDQDEQEQQQQQDQQQGQEDQDQQDQQDQQQDQQEQQDQQQKAQDQKDQQDQQQDEEAQQDQQDQQQAQADEKKLDDKMKDQILEALRQQELEQQKEFRQRKIGKVVRRAKDW